MSLVVDVLLNLNMEKVRLWAIFHPIYVTIWQEQNSWSLPDCLQTNIEDKSIINTLKLDKTENNFKYIFLNEKLVTLIEISFKFVHERTYP